MQEILLSTPEILISKMVVTFLVLIAEARALQEQYPPIMTDRGAIYPARGIVKNPDGTVILTRYPTDNTQRVPNNSSNCSV
jgi:hypothetical protein